MSQWPKKNYGPDGATRFYLQSPKPTGQLSNQVPPFCTQIPRLCYTGLTSKCVTLASCLSFKLKSNFPLYISTWIWPTHTSHSCWNWMCFSPWSCSYPLSLVSSNLTPMILSPPPSAHRVSWSQKIDVNYKCWLILPLSMAGNIVKFRPSRLTSTIATVLLVSCTQSSLHIGLPHSTGEEGLLKQKTINLLIVPIHLMHGLCPASEHHSDLPPLLSHSFKTQCSCHLLQEAFADHHPSHSFPLPPSQSGDLSSLVLKLSGSPLL